MFTSIIKMEKSIGILVTRTFAQTETGIENNALLKNKLGETMQ